MHIRDYRLKRVEKYFWSLTEIPASQLAVNHPLKYQRKQKLCCTISLKAKKAQQVLNQIQAEETKVLGLCFLSISDAFNTGGLDCLNVSEPC